MSERTVIIFTPKVTFVGKLIKMLVGFSVKEVCLCCFIDVQTRDGISQVVGLRKVGNIEDFKITPEMVVIDLERDCDIYQNYMKQITGISVTTELPSSRTH